MCTKKEKKCTGYLKARYACSTAWKKLWIMINEESKWKNLNDLLITDCFKKLDWEKDETLKKTENQLNNDMPQLMKHQLG